MNHFAISVSPLVIMLFVASITPGPNNLMLMLAGTRFGFQQTMPHILGVTTGTVVIICLTYAGLGALMLGHPHFVDGMTLACAVYLLWLAGRMIIPTAPAGQSAATPGGMRPTRFAEAVLFQFVNPKVWTMAVASSPGYNFTSGHAFVQADAAIALLPPGPPPTSAAPVTAAVSRGGGGAPGWGSLLGLAGLALARRRSLRAVQFSTPVLACANTLEQSLSFASPGSTNASAAAAGVNNKPKAVAMPACAANLPA